MNYHNEIKRLAQQYATNPATKQCFADCVKVWADFAKSVADAADKRRQQSR